MNGPAVDVSLPQLIYPSIRVDSISLIKMRVTRDNQQARGFAVDCGFKGRASDREIENESRKQKA